MAHSSPHLSVDDERALDRFERGIRALKIEFDRYFNGAIPIPPEEERNRLFGDLREMRSRPMPSLADRFRLSTLEARLNALNELYNRKLRDFELSGRPAAVAAGAIDPYSGVIVGERPEAGAVRALYEELYRASGRQKKTDFESFRSFLERETAKIRRKTGCERVRFRVTEKSGKLKLRARPVDASGRDLGS